MVPLSVTLSDLWSRFQGHDIFWSRMSEKRRVLVTIIIIIIIIIIIERVLLKCR